MDKSWQDIHYSILIEKGFAPPFHVELGPGRGGTRNDGVVRIGLNKSADPGSDIYWNLEEGIPLPDACVRRIYSNQVLEHIQNIIQLFNEQFRVLIPGGEVEHCVPHYLGPHSWGDPTHARAFTETSFRYFCLDDNGRPFVEHFGDYGITAAFILERQEVRSGLDIRVFLRKPDGS